MLSSFVGHFILFSAVKEFRESVKIWGSYCQKFGGFLFWNTGLSALPSLTLSYLEKCLPFQPQRLLVL